MTRPIDADELKLDSGFSSYDESPTAYSEMQVHMAPTLDYRPVVHAHWCDVGDIRKAMCSKCGECSTDPKSYCTNCGAQMDE